MSDQFREVLPGLESKVIPFPLNSIREIAEPKEQVILPPTPVYDKLSAEAEKLDRLSKYPCSLDYGIYRDLELRFMDKPINGGIAMKTAFRLVNSHNTCQQCLYAFEVDTYGRGCAHNCVYCYAKAELTVHGYWNNPIPVPIDFNVIRKAFYTVFETDKRNKWRELLNRRIPLRIGSMSDSFMWSDTKYKVTQELLKLLKFYDYPYVIFTRSDLVAHDDYIKLLDPKLAAVQFSMSSTNEELIRKIEPGAPSAKRRLKALQKLAESGYWTTVRLNPLFPIYPDGYFTNPDFKWDGPVPKFEYSSFDMVDELAAHKVPAVLAGFVRFSRLSLNGIERATGANLRQFYNRGEVNKSVRDFHFSDREIRYYYEQIKAKCRQHGIQFTTCYIGNGDGHFWKDQDLWSNKKDCCNVKGRVSAFGPDSREIPFSTRLKFTNHKCSVPMSDRLHEPLEKLKVARESTAQQPENFL
ncbi:MAG: radical SAM protein [Bacteriovoracia bacterium]